MWYKFAQQNPYEPLDLTKSKQNMPSSGLGVKLIGSMPAINQNSPPQEVQVQDQNGNNKSILLLHGIDSPEGVKFSIPDSSGKLYQASEDEFQQWMQQNHPGEKYIACHEGKATSSNGADALINAQGVIQVGTVTKTDPHGQQETDLIFI